MSERNQVTVNIYGRSFTMLTDESPEQTEKIAAALNERMKRLRAQKGSLSLQDAAAIISLECMEQLINTKQTEQNIRTQISAYADEAELCRSEAERLKKENEQLKARIKQLEQQSQQANRPQSAPQGNIPRNNGGNQPVQPQMNAGNSRPAGIPLAHPELANQNPDPNQNPNPNQNRNGGNRNDRYNKR